MNTSKTFDVSQWRDIEPIYHHENDLTCVRIFYEPGFDTIMAYFRALMTIQEYSVRALDLTDFVIQGNPANYSAWIYRRECLFALNSNLQDELDYTALYALNFPKNYQVSR